MRPRPNASPGSKQSFLIPLRPKSRTKIYRRGKKRDIPVFSLFLVGDIRQNNAVCCPTEIETEDDMREKRMSLSQAAGLIRNGMLVAVGGNGMHRNPTLFCLELSRTKVKDLTLCGAALGVAADVLLATRQAVTAYFGFFGLENEAGLAPGMRKAMEGDGTARAVEGS
jgi:hypothetical protein